MRALPIRSAAAGVMLTVRILRFHWRGAEWAALPNAQFFAARRGLYWSYGLAATQAQARPEGRTF